MRLFRLTTFALFFFYSFILLGDSATVIALPELANPSDLKLAHGRCYIHDQKTAAIYIYSLPDFKLLKTFGKRGEGPGEFRCAPNGWGVFMNVTPEAVLVNHFSRLSIFSLDGEYRKDIEKPQRLDIFDPFVNGLFIKRIFRFGPGLEKDYLELAICDAGLKTVKVFHRRLNPQQLAGPDVVSYNVLSATLNHAYAVCNGKLYVPGDEGFVIDVFDREGNAVRTFSHEYERVEVPPEVVAECRSLLRKSYGEDYYQKSVKKALIFPKYYPAIRNIKSWGKTLFVRTNRKKQKMSEVFILNPEGKLMRQVYLLIEDKCPYLECPYAFQDGRLYQLVEQGDDGVWGVRIATI